MKKTTLKRVPFKRGVKTPKVAKKKRIKKSTYTQLLKAADANFSRYTRLVAADAEGNVRCFTCGNRNHWKKMQNGHYISRFYKKYRFSEKNCRVQCSMCNMWKSGDIPTFRAKLLKEIGEQELAAMESDYKELYKLTPDFLKEVIFYYSQKLSSLTKEN